MTQPERRAPAGASARPFPVRILRGYWPKDGGPKLAPDTRIELPLNEAKIVILLGIAERGDALPEG